MSRTCIVIGAGLGGLSSAVGLASKGWNVTVFDMQPGPGGKAGVLNENGFRFDTGPSLITMPFVLEGIISDAGYNISDYLTIEPLSEHCRYYYPDGTVIRAHSESDDFKKEIESKTGDSSEAVDEYLKYCKRIYELTADLFVFKDFHEISNFMSAKALYTLSRIWQIDSMRTVHNANASFFKDYRTLQIFDRYATYNGSNPYKAPATLNIIPHVELNMGSYIALEGMHAVSKTLETIAKDLGVEFIYNSRVDEIIIKNKKAQGVKASGNVYTSDCVISNCDVARTYEELFKGKEKKHTGKYKKQEPSSSAVVFYWGINRVFSDMAVHSILFSENYRAEFDSIFKDKQYPNDPTIYIYVSSRFKKDDAPPGCENWFVMINVPHNRGQNWKREAVDIRKIIISKINKMLGIDIETHIVSESIATPETIELCTNSKGGSIYGISSNSKTAAFMRHPVRSASVKGLYFCGGSAHPGGGIPLVLQSGKLASELIMRYET